MEARQTLKGNAVPKAITVMVGLSAAIGLAMAASVVTRDFGSSSATVKSPVHAAPNTVLRQDNPAHSSVEPAPGTVLRQNDPAASKDAAAPADSQRGHRGGIQSI